MGKGEGVCVCVCGVWRCVYTCGTYTVCETIRVGVHVWECCQS